MIPRASSVTVAMLLALASALTAPVAAQVKTVAAKAPASAPQPGLNFVLEGGFEFGGDQVVELLFQDGSTQKLTAGQGGTIAFGGQYRPASVPRLAIGATLGYKFVTNA